MVKAARFIAQAAIASAAASLLGWLVRQSPLFSGLAAWLVIGYVITIAALIALDDAAIEYLRMEPTTYYGMVITWAIAIFLGALLVWLN
jgi:branched-subunit amino acid ABC-type transport system permease component